MERICAPKKEIKTLARRLELLRFLEVFGFRGIVTGPRGRSEAMRLSRIRPVRSDGVVRSLTHHFHQALGTGWVRAPAGRQPLVAKAT